MVYFVISLFRQKILYDYNVMKHNYISDLNNYKTELVDSEHRVFLKFVGLIHEFIEVSIQNITIKSLQYFKYILINGLKHISHIYKLVLLYTLNLDLSVHYTQKSIVYYTEFIQQISDESHSFLNLSVKDASLFALKKTLYEINDKHVESYSESDSTKILFNQFDRYSKIYNTVIFSAIDSYTDKNKIADELPKLVFTSIYSLVQELLQLSLINKNEYPVHDVVYYYTKLLQNYDIKLSISQYINHITTFIKELYKRKNNITTCDDISKYFENNNIILEINTLSPLKFTKKMLHK